MAPAKKSAPATVSTAQVQKLARRVVQEGLKSPAYQQLTQALAQTPEQLRALNTAAGYSRMTASVTESKMPILCWGATPAGKAVARDMKDLERDLGRLLRDISKLVVSRPAGKARAAAASTAAKRPAPPRPAAGKTVAVKKAAPARKRAAAARAPKKA